MDKSKSRVNQVAEDHKYEEVVKIGKWQLSDSKQSYLSFRIALELTKKRWQVSFTEAEAMEAERRWIEKYKLSEKSEGKHDIDEGDGFCYECGSYHSGDNSVVLYRMQNMSFEREVRRKIVCQNTFLDEDGWCGKCGKNHNGGEAETEPDKMVLKSVSKHRTRTVAQDGYPVTDISLWRIDLFDQVEEE